MNQWFVLFVALLVFGSTSLKGASAAPRIGASSSLSANGANQNELPEEELELESLKLKSNGGNRDSKPPSGAARADVKEPTNTPTPTPESRPPAQTKTPVLNINLEQPSKSDNDNENSGKSQSSALDEKRKELGGARENPLLASNRFQTSNINTGLNPDIDYTPQDIAEYVFWTGDEQGVSLALNDFLQDELVTKQDVIRFLEDVKIELNLLKQRYNTATNENPIRNFPLDQSLTKNHGFMQKKTFNEATLKKELAGDYPFEFGNTYDNLARTYNSQPNQPFFQTEKIQQQSNEEEDYEELVEKIRQADVKYRESSLEEIIYQLAKELFSEELQNKPTHSVQRFAKFLENEAALGRIPKDLGKAVLDTLVGALVDAVSEQQQGNSKLETQVLPKPKPTTIEQLKESSDKIRQFQTKAKAAGK